MSFLRTSRTPAIRRLVSRCRDRSAKSASSLLTFTSPNPSRSTGSLPKISTMKFYLDRSLSRTSASLSAKEPLRRKPSSRSTTRPALRALRSVRFGLGARTVVETDSIALLFRRPHHAGGIHLEAPEHGRQGDGVWLHQDCARLVVHQGAFFRGFLCLRASSLTPSLGFDAPCDGQLHRRFDQRLPAPPGVRSHSQRPSSKPLTPLHSLSDPEGGISLSVVTHLRNPSPFGVALGTLEVGLYYQGVYLG